MSQHVHICLPCYRGTVRMEAVQSIVYSVAMILADLKIGFTFQMIDAADIVAIRNAFISDFYYKLENHDHLLFIDDDMAFSPQLIKRMFQLKEDVVGAVYSKRQYDMDKLRSAKASTTTEALSKASTFIVKHDATTQFRGGFMSVDHVGTGIMLISRRAITTMIEKLPEILDPECHRIGLFKHRLTKGITPFDPVEVNGMRLSEDFSFCYRWKELCGGTIWANIDEPITHVGNIGYTAKYSDVIKVEPPKGKIPAVKPV